VEFSALWTEAGEESNIDPQIDAVRTVVSQNLSRSTHPFVTVGERVRVVSGTFDSIEGMLLSRNQAQSLALSVEALRRSRTIRIAGYQVEAPPIIRDRSKRCAV
jgi:transcription antitermination factor NusG